MQCGDSVGIRSKLEKIQTMPEKEIDLSNLSLHNHNLCPCLLENIFLQSGKAKTEAVMW